jgi:hypothetical protein
MNLNRMIMKTLLLRLAAVLMTGSALFLTSCAHPYRSGFTGGGLQAPRATPPLLRSAVADATHNARATTWLFANTRFDPCSPGYHTRHARPYYANYGWGRPYHGSTWYAWPYTSQWRSPGYTRYQHYSSPLVSYGWPMSHHGGWSYVYRPAGWPASSSFYRCGW